MPETASPFQAELADALRELAPAGSPIHTEPGRAAVGRVASACRENLLDQVLPFWEPRVLDPGRPGLLHYLDRAGELTATDKSTWGQGRMAYTFSLLTLELTDAEPARRERWQAMAAAARRMVAEHAHAGGGRWHYLCDRDGNVKAPDRSAFSDAFALMGLSAHALLSGRDEDLPLIHRGLATLTENLQSPAFNEYHHFRLDPASHWHGPAMVAMGLAPLARAVLGDEAVRPLADWAYDRILWQFASDEHQMLLEQTDPQGRLVETGQGRTANPGHALESMWFCMEEALHRRSRRGVDRVLQITRWAFEKGWDGEHGGLFAFVDADGGRPRDGEVIAWGDRWDDKLWWVHAEAIYTLALAAALSDDPFYLRSLKELADWTLAHLPDREHGEWMLSVARDGRPQNTTKGNVFRSAFHVPRALLKVARLGDTLAGAG